MEWILFVGALIMSLALLSILSSERELRVNHFTASVLESQRKSKEEN